MSRVKPKIIVILGPTASGKSDIALKLAKKFHGEIISADSRQVYRGMDLGTGKVQKDESKIKKQESRSNIFSSEGVQHHLIDIINPEEEFNVSHFKKAAQEAIEEILAKEKVPIICGGTGFWIQALTDNIILPEVKPDPVLRNMLRSKSTEELFFELEKLDPERAQTIDAKNPVRLIRAIEIATTLGKVPTKKNHIENKYEFLQIAILVPREILNEKIKKRLDERLEQGMIQEVANLHENRVSWQWMEQIGLEYRWISRYLQNKITQEEMKEKLYFDIIHYAKRQMTWLKKNKKILWRENYAAIEEDAAMFLKNNQG